MSEYHIVRRDFLRLCVSSGVGVAAGFGRHLAKGVACPVVGKPPLGSIVVGLEIGTSKVCVAVAERLPDGTIQILGIGQAPSRGVTRYGIVNCEAASRCVAEALLDAEVKTDVMIRSVVLAVAGAGARIKNSIRCVKDLGVEIERTVFAPVASAHAVLSASQKKLGALVIDLGEGTTDCAVYAGARKRNHVGRQTD
jgi:cell division ATPase FtsA